MAGIALKRRNKHDRVAMRIPDHWQPRLQFIQRQSLVCAVGLKNLYLFLHYKFQCCERDGGIDREDEPPRPRRTPARAGAIRFQPEPRGCLAWFKIGPETPDFGVCEFEPAC